MRNDFCSNYLEHSAKGTTWKNVMYIAKVKLSSGKYFYFYDQRQYQNYLKRRNQVGTAKAQIELSKQPAKRTVSTSSQTSSSSSSSLKDYSTKTTEEKKAATNNFINEGKAASTALTATASSATASAGKTKAQELLERARGKADSSSSKKSGSGSSKSSSKSSGSKSKSSGSSSKSKSAKESTGSKSTKQTKEKTTKETTAKITKTKSDGKLKAEERSFTTESLKKLYGIKDSDVNKHESTEKMLDKLRSYKDGAYGYIVSGNTTYKWTKENGNIVFKDFKTDKEVSLPSALKNIEEFRTDKKNKK